MSEGLARDKAFHCAPMQRVAWAGALAASLLGSTVRAQVAAAGEPTGVAADTFQAAMVEYERCHWSEAWELLARTADGGDPQAARLALDMHRFGPSLFGRTFSVGEARLAAWKESSRGD